MRDRVDVLEINAIEAVLVDKTDDGVDKGSSVCHIADENHWEPVQPHMERDALTAYLHRKVSR
jgi:hypothetical protein